MGQAAETFITAGAAAGQTMLPKDRPDRRRADSPAHGETAVARAVERAVRFGRFGADDVASILAINPLPDPAHPGDRVVVDLPAAEIRSLDAYRTGDLA